MYSFTQSHLVSSSSSPGRLVAQRQTGCLRTLQDLHGLRGPHNSHRYRRPRGLRCERINCRVNFAVSEEGREDAPPPWSGSWRPQRFYIFWVVRERKTPPDPNNFVFSGWRRRVKSSGPQRFSIFWVAEIQNRWGSGGFYSPTPPRKYRIVGVRGDFTLPRHPENTNSLGFGGILLSHAY